MAALVGAKSRHLNIIAQQVRILGNLVVLTGEELLLVIEAGSPCEVATDLEIFTQNMAHHVRSMNAFARRGIVRASRSMNVVVTGPPV